MSTLYISEFADLPITSNGALQAAAGQSWIDDQTITISGSSSPSAAFNPATVYVLLSTDSVCSIAWTMAGAGSVNAATTGNLRIPPNQLMIFGVAGGMKISAIANS